MNKKLVRASYEGCLDSTARLAAYATSRPFLDAFEVNDRQDILAADDLVVFCIHARRLIENVEFDNIVKEITIRASDDTHLSLWGVIGGLIHHNDLEILRSQTRIRMLQVRLDSKIGDEFWEKVTPELTKNSYSEPVVPQVIFRSDKIPYKMISLGEFMQIFSEKIIPGVIKKAYESGLDLADGIFKDLDLSDPKISQILSRIGAV